MVNARTTKTDASKAAERRERARTVAPEPAALGLTNPNPFGDLHTIQHLTARLARSLRPALRSIYRGDCRVWAEPVVVERLVDYRAGRGDALAGWLALPGGHEACAQVVFDGTLVLELLDLFFGGAGVATAGQAAAFSPAAEAIMRRLGEAIVPAMVAAWEPVTRIDFTVGSLETNPTTLRGVVNDDAVVLTRIGIARSDNAPRHIDILYPVAALKPYHESITRKVHAAAPDVAPAWRQNLTRAVMNVTFPVRTVLAEPVIPLSQLLALKVGDVIPIGLGEQVPVMVGNGRLGMGTVGTAGGRAAIQLNSFALLEGPVQ